MQEGISIATAYELRAPGQKGIQFRAWGSLLGQLLLHSIDRAQLVYESMQLRGFAGSFSARAEKARRLAVFCSNGFLLRHFPRRAGI